MSETSDPQDASLALNLARLMERQDDLQGAYEAYRYALDLGTPTDRSTAEAALGMGRVLERLGRLPEAGTAYQQAIDHAVAADESVAAGAWLGLAGVAERLGDLDEARTAYQQAIDHAVAADESVAAGAWLGLAGVAERLGDLDEARTAYQQAIDHAVAADESVAAGAWLGLAGVAERLGDLDEARTAYQQAIKHGAPRESAMARLALSIIKEKKTEHSNHLRLLTELLAGERPPLRRSRTHAYPADAAAEALLNPHFFSWAIVDEPSRFRKAGGTRLLLIIDTMDDMVSGVEADDFALRGDEHKLSEDSRVALIKFLAENHRDVMLAIIVNHARRESRIKATFFVTKRQDEAAVGNFTRSLALAFNRLQKTGPADSRDPLIAAWLRLSENPHANPTSPSSRNPLDEGFKNSQRADPARDNSDPDRQ